MFKITKEQNAKLIDWINARPEANTGCIGGRFTHSFTHTFLGTVYTVKDNATNEVIDLTEYEFW